MITLTDDEQETFRRGLAAASLLESQELKETLHSITVECFAVFTETAPDAGGEREDAYNLMRGLKALENELSARVQAKDALELRINSEEQYPEDEPYIDDISGPITISGD